MQLHKLAGRFLTKSVKTILKRASLVMGVLWLTFSLLPLSMAANSQERQDNPSSQQTAKVEQPQNRLTLDTSSIEKAIRESIKEVSEKPDTQANEKLDIDKKLSKYTGELSAYTFWLVVATAGLGCIAIWQGIQLKRSVDIAVAEAQPILSPYVTNMENLHPIIVPEGLDSNEAIAFDSRLLLAFENHGKTPAIVRQVRADLFVTERDQLPSVDFETLPLRFYQETIPGETSRKSLEGPHAEVTKTFQITSIELSEILREAHGQFRRFFLVGSVIYDDFFGGRHVRRFCLKMRLTPSIRFQAQHGGMTYNSVKRSKIPRKSDPLDKDTETN